MVADTPQLDDLAKSIIGSTHTRGHGLEVIQQIIGIGYNPKQYWTVSFGGFVGVNMKETDIARCNLVTLSEDEVAYEEKEMIDLVLARFQQKMLFLYKRLNRWKMKSINFI